MSWMGGDDSDNCEGELSWWGRPLGLMSGWIEHAKQKIQSVEIAKQAALRLDLTSCLGAQHRVACHCHRLKLFLT